MRGCGKSVFGEVAQGLGYPVYEMRDIVVEMMEKNDEIINNRNMREFGKNIREQYGKDVVARGMIEKITSERKEGLIIIVGVRGMYEIRAFKNAFGNDNVLIVAIHSPPRERFERVMKRTNKSDDPKSYEDFLWSEEMELGYGISKVIALADRIIVNEGCLLDEFIDKCKSIIKEAG